MTKRNQPKIIYEIILMYEINNITLEYFVKRKETIIIYRYHKVWIIMKLNEKARAHRAHRLYF